MTETHLGNFQWGSTPPDYQQDTRTVSQGHWFQHDFSMLSHSLFNVDCSKVESPGNFSILAPRRNINVVYPGAMQTKGLH